MVCEKGPWGGAGSGEGGKRRPKSARNQDVLVPLCMAL